MNLVYDSSFDAHHITPKAGTARQLDGQPADLLNPRDYPVRGRMPRMGGPIRVERYYRSEWVHIARFSDHGASHT